MDDSNDIWHDVCPACHPDYAQAICGTELNYDPEVGSTTPIDQGTDCIVCADLLCPTCPPIVSGKLETADG